MTVRDDCFRNGHRLAGEHAFVDAGTSGLDDAINGKSLAGPDQNHFADFYGFDRHIEFLTIPFDTRCLRPQPDQRTNRAAGSARCSDLQQIAEENKRMIEAATS